LAKLANRWAKKMGRVFRVEGGEAGREILAATPAADVWGIGRGLDRKLAALGVRTAWDLSRLDLAAAKKNLTVKGLKTVLELNGTQAIDDDLWPAPPKSLVSSRSFGAKISDPETLMEALASHCAAVGARLRAEKLLTPALSAFIGTAHYIDRPFQTGAAASLPAPTNHTPELIGAARRALFSCFRPGIQYARAGVMAFDLTPATPQTPSLFPPPPYVKDQEKLMAAVDRINREYGRGAIGFSATKGQAPWRTRRDRLSQGSTTSWAALPVAKAV
jgi:DNA polymerase V